MTYRNQFMQNVRFTLGQPRSRWHNIGLVLVVFSVDSAVSLAPCTKIINIGYDDVFEINKINHEDIGHTSTGQDVEREPMGQEDLQSAVIMANRRAQPEAQRVFEKYIPEDCTARRLAREDAIDMLQKEFKINQTRAMQMFDHFDADKNGFLSLWEFQHFFNIVGYRAPDVIKQFESLDNAHNDYLDPMTVWDVLKETKTGDGEMLDDREVELFLKATLKEPGNDKVFLGDFVDLLARLHFYRKAKKAK